MAERSNLDIVKEGYELFGKGDIPGLINLMADDVVWKIPGEGNPLQGTYRGHDGLKKFFTALDGESDIQEFGAHTFIADGNRVVALGSERSIAKRTGKPITTEWAHVFTLEGGKVKEFAEYTDTAAIANALS